MAALTATSPVNVGTTPESWAQALVNEMRRVSRPTFLANGSVCSTVTFDITGNTLTITSGVASKEGNMATVIYSKGPLTNQINFAPNAAPASVPQSYFAAVRHALSKLAMPSFLADGSTRATSVVATWDDSNQLSIVLS